MNTKTYILTEFLGEEFDATIYTNGGTYHKVVVENIEDSSRYTRRFYSRDKAYKFAEEQAK